MLLKVKNTFTKSTSNHFKNISKHASNLQENNLAIKLLNARQYEIIKIGYEDDGLIAKFGIDERECDERKELLLGPDDIYIKPLEELTGCFVIVNWNTDTVIATGLFEGLKLVRMIVEECIVCKIPAVDIINKIRTRGAGALLW
ncbi:KRR1 small subunit processome component-like [Malus domestica]|uniref:KRR1 small subunit processome component-like n=1 Tax=Malus domestica TaxID=3750 RepID=UPI003976466E